MVRVKGEGNLKLRDSIVHALLMCGCCISGVMGKWVNREVELSGAATAVVAA